MKILLLENIHSVAKQTLEKAGYKVDLHDKSYEGDELVKVAQGYDAIGIRSKTYLTQEVLKSISHLQAIGCFCIGTNQVQLESACAQGVPVFNAPYSNTRSVAELVMCEIVALSRGLCDLSQQVHQGSWQKSAAGSFEVRNKTLGIIGYGHIGSQVSILAEAFGLKVIYYDIVKKLPLGNSQQVDSLDELLSQSDFVTLHVPATEATSNMMTYKQLKKMKQGSCLINASRGSVVHIPDLAKALKEQHIAGAAVDVYPSEPKKNSEGFESELQGCKNVILTPHIGGSTQEAQYAIGLEVASSLIQFLNTGQTVGAVQFPHIQAPQRENTHRVLNIHRNVPGVLGQINSIVSELGENIQAQHLSTNNQIGYLLMDIEKGHEEVAQRISQLDTNIKTRLLY